MYVLVVPEASFLFDVDPHRMENDSESFLIQSRNRDQVCIQLGYKSHICHMNSVSFNVDCHTTFAFASNLMPTGGADRDTIGNNFGRYIALICHVA